MTSIDDIVITLSAAKNNAEFGVSEAQELSKELLVAADELAALIEDEPGLRTGELRNAALLLGDLAAELERLAGPLEEVYQMAQRAEARA